MKHADLVLGACRSALDAALEGPGSGSQPTSSFASHAAGGLERTKRRRRRPLHRRLLGLVGRGGGESEEEVEEGRGWSSSSSPSCAGGGKDSPSAAPSTLAPSSSKQQQQQKHGRRRPRLGAKLAGVHWWYGHPSHAAELTVRFFFSLQFFPVHFPLFSSRCSLSLSFLSFSLKKKKKKNSTQAGYYNVYHRDGYLPLLDLLASHGAAASLTCVEMRDCEHPPHAHCRPQALLDQVVAAASVAGSSGDVGSSSSAPCSPSPRRGVPLAGENALQRYDDAAASALVERAASLSQLTFLRMGDLMFDNWGAFAALLARLRVRE